MSYNKACYHNNTFRRGNEAEQNKVIKSSVLNQIKEAIGVTTETRSTWLASLKYRPVLAISTDHSAHFVCSLFEKDTRKPVGRPC